MQQNQEAKQNVSETSEKKTFLNHVKNVIDEQKKIDAPDGTDTGSDGTDNHFDNVQ